MIITSERKNMPVIKIANVKQKSYIIKYLGIFLDGHLSWEYQIKHVNNKIAKNVGIITKLRYRAFNGGRAITIARAHTRPDSTKRAIDRAGKYQTLERSVCCFNNFSSDLF